MKHRGGEENDDGKERMGHQNGPKTINLVVEIRALAASKNKIRRLRGLQDVNRKAAEEVDSRDDSFWLWRKRRRRQ